MAAHWLVWLGVRNHHPLVLPTTLLAACTTNSHPFPACTSPIRDLQPQMPVAQPQMPVSPPQPTVAASAAKAPAQPSLMGLMSFSGPAPGEFKALPELSCPPAQHLCHMLS